MESRKSGVFLCSKDWSSKHEIRPIFDILSTVKKSQKRPEKDVSFPIYQPANASEDEMDKENQPIQVERGNDPSSVREGTEREEKRIAVVEDIEMDETGSITRRDSVMIQQLLSQSQSGRSSVATNQISDVDESAPFMNGSRDTADEGILMGITDLYNKYWIVCWKRDCGVKRGGNGLRERKKWKRDG